MVDYSLAEIDAIEKCFPTITVYIYDFHRVQAWQRWAKASKNGLSHDQQKDFLRLMQNLAYAGTPEQYNKKLEELKKWNVYVENRKVRDYCDKVWLQCFGRWAHAFRKQQVANIVNTNNGVERQNHLFKYSYLPRSIDKSIYGIALMLVESFIPGSYQRYLDTNLKLSSCHRRYHGAIPEYLHNRPPNFVKHCLKSKFASAEYKQYDIRCVNHERGEFLVRSTHDNNLFYAVKFETPSCQCESWRKSQYPCKHFFAIFNFFDEWSFSCLPEFYRNSVFLTLDIDHVTAHMPAGLDVEPTKQQCSSQCGSVRSNDDANSEGLENENIISVAEADHDSDRKSDEGNPDETAKSSTWQPNAMKVRRILLEKLDSLKNLAFVVDDSKALDDASSAIDKIILDLYGRCTDQNGLPLRQSPVKKKLKTTSVDYHKVFHKKLPKRRKFTKKVASHVTVEDKKPVETITTEEVSLFSIL